MSWCSPYLVNFLDFLIPSCILDRVLEVPNQEDQQALAKRETNKQTNLKSFPLGKRPGKGLLLEDIFVLTTKNLFGNVCPI